MKLFITGGAGFIGSHLAERALDSGWTVSVLDDLSTGSVENIASLKGRPGFSYLIDSVFNRAAVEELVDDSDFVFHLAAAVGVQLIVESPVRTIETNVHGTEVVLRAVAKKKKPILIASTSEVYGKSVELPFTEDADLVLGATTRGRWSYACSKALDEFLGLAYWNEKRVPVTVARFFNTVGPRQTGQYGMVLPRFASQALRGDPITVYGTGEQQRCFGHVADAVEALIRITMRGGFPGEVVNIGNDEEISIRTLAEMVKEEAGSPSEIRTIPYSEAYGPGFEDMFRRVPSLEKLEKLIGFRPRKTTRETVQSVIRDIQYRRFETAAAA
jgi:UDP-glucose 4-epimerase